MSELNTKEEAINKLCDIVKIDNDCEHSIDNLLFAVQKILQIEEYSKDSLIQNLKLYYNDVLKYREQKKLFFNGDKLNDENNN